MAANYRKTAIDDMRLSELPLDGSAPQAAPAEQAMNPWQAKLDEAAVRLDRTKGVFSGDVSPFEKKRGAAKDRWAALARLFGG